MANTIKKPYEISLWDEILVFRVECFDANGESLGVIEKEKNLEGFEPLEGTKTTTTIQYYKERKIAIIGSNTMDTPIRAVNSKLVSNVNGSNTLTFSLYSKYWDEETEQLFDNPFLKLLVNERKIKLRYGAIGDCKWYDLIIKNVQENSETKTFVYTAKDQFVNELSKSGFEIVLDAKLENNMGNITTLGNTVLEGSDWKLGNDNSLLRQFKEEPLYEIVLNRDLEVINILDESDKIVISKGQIIYGFYGIVSNKEEHFQLLYNKDGYKVDDDYVITNSKIWFVQGVTYNKDGEPDFANGMGLSKDYRGERFVRQVKTKYDSTIDKYVQIYESNGDEYYGYTEREYVSPTTVQNFVTSPSGFVDYNGWEVGGVSVGGATEYPSLTLQGFPDMRDIPLAEVGQTDYTSFLKYKASNSNQFLYNSGIADFRADINGFVDQEQFVFRIKYATAEENDAGRPIGLTYQTVLPRIRVGSYELKNGVYSLLDTYFDSEGTTAQNADNYVWTIMKCVKSVPYSEMIKAKLGLFLEFPVTINWEEVKVSAFYIEDVQFFRYVTYEKDGQNVMAIPGGELTASVRTKYFYYQPGDYKDISEVVYAYEGYEPWLVASEKYNEDNFEKIRSITAKESNRFNLIQTLCETFECWPKFEIEHNMATGEILLDENDDYRQKKWVTFHEYVGKDNYAGFRYGVNLKSIQRTLDSNGAVSKLIVKNNANQFADNGFCNIARASENPIGENFIYDFSYYIQQGLMTFNEINNDFYLDTSGYLGYYKKLRELNRNRDEWIEEQTGLKMDIVDFQSSYQTYKVSVESAEEDLRATELGIEQFAGWTYTQLLDIYNRSEAGETLEEEEQRAMLLWESDELIKKVNQLALLKNTITKHSEWRDRAKVLLDEAEARDEELTSLLDELTTDKRALNLQFYKKYSRFIQEGSWIKEDYIDDNLYYLDAESALRTSAQPKVTYNINVLELSQLEGYENYNFELGDKTYIEDTEFFGWTWTNGVRSPYHEEIVVSETTIVLDSPEQNTIKVQNYKTQFEDLFQRITATTQSVEYHTGEYSRAAGVVETNGTIVAETLQNSITNNAISLKNAKDQTVEWNEAGITTASLSRPNEIVRIISGGIFMSVDGGITWNTGITGSGINASYITSGYLNTGVINIMNNGVPSFRWDSTGLNAYQFQIDQTSGKPYGFNIAKFVRFDQYGIYGINGLSEFDPNISQNGKIGEEKIWDNANYALTWKGFMLKTDNGSVRITSDNDIQVMGGNQERIKIGQIKEDTYGIRISNASNEAVMETDDLGELWLKNRLRVGTNNTSTVEIGYLDATRTETNIHEVFHAGNGDQEFVVYEDGKMIAQGAEFHGGVFADYGQIGNMTIGDVQSGIESTKGIEIIADKGTTFQIDANNEVILNELDFRMVEKNITIESTNDIIWELSSSFEVDDWTFLSHDVQVSVPYQASMFLNNTCFLRVTVQSSEGKNYSKFITIHRVSDGRHPIILTVTSTTGEVYINGEIRAELRATVWRNGVDITSSYDEQAFVWTKYDRSGVKDLTWIDYGPVIEIDHTEVEQKATFSCELIQE